MLKDNRGRVNPVTHRAETWMRATVVHRVPPMRCTTTFCPEIARYQMVAVRQDLTGKRKTRHWCIKCAAKLPEALRPEEGVP